MCRLLGVVSEEPTAFRIVLHETPRSLAALSREHRDGWGVAVYESGRAELARAASGASGPGWRLHRSVACAAEDEDFRRLASMPAEVLISHVRSRTVGAVSLENTHPFRRGRWVFAHNGTIHRRDRVRAGASARRLAEMKGHTDSELFFAYLLTELDAAGLGDAPASHETDAVLRSATRRMCDDAAFGAANFLLSEGTAMYAHRFGRTLFVLERGASGHAVLVASEAMTDEPWTAVEERALLRIDRIPGPRWRRVAA